MKTLFQRLPSLKALKIARTNVTKAGVEQVELRHGDIFATRLPAASADLVIVTMLFMEDHIRAVMPALEARRESCDAMVIFMSSGEVIKLTKLGRFRMDAPTGAVVNLLKKLRGGKTEDAGDKAAAGARQLQMLKRVPKILRFIPGTAQDVRAYFLTMQYWLAGSEDNLAHLVRFLVARYANTKRAGR